MTGRRLLLFVSAALLVAVPGAAVPDREGGIEAGAAAIAPPTRPDPKSAAVALPAARETRGTTPTTVALPVPDPPPDDPYAEVPVVRIGSIEIPRIGLNHPVYEGVTLTVIDRGPGHWPGTANPGMRGNAVFAGHRVTHSHPFYDLDLLAPGDAVIFHTRKGEFTYEVTETLVVAPQDLWVVDQTREPTMTLVACHPKHSARQRIVVKGRLVTRDRGAGLGR